MSKSQPPLGNLEIKKTSWGFLLEKNGHTLEIRDTYTFLLLKVLAKAIHEKDLEMLAHLLPASFMAEHIYYDANQQIQDKRIVFISDSPDFSSHFKAIMDDSHILAIQPEYFSYDDTDIFSREIDLIVAFHRFPRKPFFVELNRVCLDRGIPFIKTMMDNVNFIVTPFLLPHESACYNCYSILKRRNHIFDRDTLAPQDFIHISAAHPPDFMLRFCAGFLVVTLVKFLTTEHFLQEDLSEIVLDFKQIDISKHPLLRL
ncbi:MAG: hypothetical protein EHM71_04565, partial [Zetaproteobacteria bacterium]